MSGYVLGIDPGLTGGVVVLPFGGASCMFAKPMPTMPAGGSKREVDPAELCDMISQFQDMLLLAVIEKVGARPGQGVTSMFSFGYSCGVVCGIVGGMGVRIERPTPQRWKKDVLHGLNRSDPAAEKGAAIAYCRRAFPGVNLIPPGCRVPHSGIAEALCMAEWGRRLLTGKAVA